MLADGCQFLPPAPGVGVSMWKLILKLLRANRPDLGTHTALLGLDFAALIWAATSWATRLNVLKKVSTNSLYIIQFQSKLSKIELNINKASQCIFSQ